MPLILDATAGSATANTYATRAEADTYHTTRGFSDAWTGAGTGEKDAALTWATRLLDGLFEWAGWSVSATQALQWPRDGVMNRTGLALLSTSAIPQEIKNATAELARQLLVADRTADSDVEAAGLKQLRAGPVELTFDETKLGKVAPDSLRTLIPRAWYTRGPWRMASAPLMRV